MSDLPEEIEDALQNFDSSIAKVNVVLQPLLDGSYAEISAKLEPAQKARFELTLAFAVNSLFWMYLNASGTPPKDHPVKQELDRIKEYMQKVKKAVDQQESKRNSELNVQAAQRFLRNALWEEGDTDNAKKAELLKEASKSLPASSNNKKTPKKAQSSEGTPSTPSTSSTTPAAAKRPKSTSKRSSKKKKIQD